MRARHTPMSLQATPARATQWCFFVFAFPVGVVVAEVRIVSAHTVCSLHEGPPEICRSALGHAFTRCHALTGLTFGRVHTNIGHELMGTIEALIVSDLACDN